MPPVIDTISPRTAVLLADRTAFAVSTQDQWSIRGDFAIGEDQPIVEWSTEHFPTELEAWEAAIHYIYSRS